MPILLEDQVQARRSQMASSKNSLFGFSQQSVKINLTYRFVIHKILVSRGLFMNLLKSVPKNKSIVFNGLQAKMTGSNPVALTTFLHQDSGFRNNVLANNSLKTLLIKNFLKSIKVSCKCLWLQSKLQRKEIRMTGNNVSF